MNADIPEIEAIFLDGFEQTSANVLGVKGIGELGNSGANAAVAKCVCSTPPECVSAISITLEAAPGLPLVET